MAYNHGITTSERATSLTSPVRVDSAVPMVFGTAPIVLGNRNCVNRPVFCNSYKEAAEELGYFEDFSAGFTLNEVIYSQFNLYGVAPIIFVNVLDPEKHKTAAEPETVSFEGSRARISRPCVLHETVAVSYESDDVAADAYSLSYDEEGGTIIEKTPDGILKNAPSVVVRYEYLDPSLVTSADILGGTDAETGTRKGLELVSEAYPRFRTVPSILAAPGFGHRSEIAAALSAKADSINGLFKAVAVVDLFDDGAGKPEGYEKKIKKYSDAAAWKNSENITGANVIAVWPKVVLGGRQYWMSTHLIGVLGKTDAANDSAPYKSPSNEPMRIDGLVNDGAEVILTPEDAALLNSQGVVTALNFIGGFRAWGNRTAAYPAVTDVKDCAIPVRRMFAWVNNTIVLSYWQKVDYPVRRRTIDSIRDSVTYWLNGLASREIILGGRIVFDEADNPATDVMDGIIRFRLYLTPPSPAREISFCLEYDPAYLEGLFK